MRLERYSNVVIFCFLFLSTRLKGPKYKWGCLAVSWCIYFIMASLFIVGQTSFFVCMVFFLVLVIDTYCCLSVLKRLKKPPPGDKNMMCKKKKDDKRKNHQVAEQGMQEQCGRTEGGKEARAKRKPLRERKERRSVKKQAFNTIVIIQAVLTLNYTPFILMLILQRLVPSWTFKCYILTLALAAASCCSYLQPLLYLQRQFGVWRTRPREA